MNFNSSLKKLIALLLVATSILACSINETQNIDTARTLREHFTNNELRIWYDLDNLSSDGFSPLNNIIIVENSSPYIHPVDSEIPIDLRFLETASEFSDEEIKEILLKEKVATWEKILTELDKVNIDDFPPNINIRNYSEAIEYLEYYIKAFSNRNPNRTTIPQDFLDEVINIYNELESDDSFKKTYFDFIHKEDPSNILDLYEQENHNKFGFSENYPAIKLAIYTESNSNTVKGEKAKFLRYDNLNLILERLRTPGKYRPHRTLNNISFDGKHTITYTYKFTPEVEDWDNNLINIFATPTIEEYFFNQKDQDETIKFDLLEQSYGGYTHQKGILITKGKADELFLLDMKAYENIILNPIDF